MSRRIEKTRRAETILMRPSPTLASETGMRLSASCWPSKVIATNWLMPGLGARRSFRREVLKELRSLPVSGFENYLIFYMPVADGIRVIRIVHGARDLDRLFRQT